MACSHCRHDKIGKANQSTEGLDEGLGKVPSDFIRNTIAREIFEAKETQDKELGLMLLKKDERKMSAGRGVTYLIR
jgi:hypothetical protein